LTATFIVVLFPGEETNMFTVGLVHNGFSCGLREELEYVDATYYSFDYCSSDTWSMFWVDEILRMMGLSSDGRLRVYWLLREKDLEDELVPLESQAVMRQMINAGKSTKTLHVYVYHTNFLNNLRSDVIIAPPAPPPRHAASAAPPPSNAAPPPSHAARAANVGPPPTQAGSSRSSIVRQRKREIGRTRMIVTVVLNTKSI
jgi:hypothetical protein